jgi:hypothetical protein
MKALSVKSPWAEMIRSGEKGIEYRSWQTSYRGPLLICCSKKPDSRFAGLAVCVVDLVDVRLGWGTGMFEWIISDPRPIKPFPVRGKQGFFDVPLPTERKRSISGRR